jgi:hypothetical protein
MVTKAGIVMNPYTAAFLWLGTWHLEASRFYIDWAEKLIELE